MHRAARATTQRHTLARSDDVRRLSQRKRSHGAGETRAARAVSAAMQQIH
jgi:hypothetical protein